MAEVFSERVARLAQQLFKEQVEMLKEMMAPGHLEPPEYKLVAGKIEGLRIAERLLEQALSDSMKG